MTEWISQIKTGRPLLTPRQIEILELVSLGKTEAEIAMILLITQSTVHTQKDQIYRRLQVDNSAHAVRMAIKNGYLQA